MDFRFVASCLGVTGILGTIIGLFLVISRRHFGSAIVFFAVSGLEIAYLVIYVAVLKKSPLDFSMVISGLCAVVAVVTATWSLVIFRQRRSLDFPGV